MVSLGGQSVLARRSEAVWNVPRSDGWFSAIFSLTKKRKANSDLFITRSIQYLTRNQHDFDRQVLLFAREPTNRNQKILFLTQKMKKIIRCPEIISCELGVAQNVVRSLFFDFGRYLNPLNKYAPKTRAKNSYEIRNLQLSINRS